MILSDKATYIAGNRTRDVRAGLTTRGAVINFAKRYLMMGEVGTRRGPLV